MSPEQECDPDITNILAAIRLGDQKAADELFPAVYRKMHNLAQSKMQRERGDHTLQPTALVHEAYLRLLGNRETDWENRRHFFAAASEAMRRILVENARRRNADKRGGQFERVSFDSGIKGIDPTPIDYLALDEALLELESIDERKAMVVKLRYFAGLSLDEVSQLIAVSLATVKTDWTYAKAWLYRKLKA